MVLGLWRGPTDPLNAGSGPAGSWEPQVVSQRRMTAVGVDGRTDGRTDCHARVLIKCFCGTSKLPQLRVREEPDKNTRIQIHAWKKFIRRHEESVSP